MSSYCYDSFLDNALRGNIDLDSDTFYVMLTDVSYTPNQGAHAYRSDVTGEVVGTGYPAGGVPVTVTLTKDTTNHKCSILFGAISIPTSVITARRAVYYKRRGGSASADELVAQDDFGTNIINDGGTFALTATTINLNTPT